MFGHKKIVEEKENQIGELNKVILERKNKIKVLEGTIESLNRTIDEITRKNPSIEEAVRLRTYASKLKEEIRDLEEELEAMKQSVGIAYELADIDAERKKLEGERQALFNYQKSSYKPSEIIICAYAVPNINDIAIDAFVFKARGVMGVLYTSLGGGRTMKFTPDFQDYLVDNYRGTINAFPKQFVTFEEACLAIGSDLYLREQVSALEIHNLLQQFRSGFYFYGKTNLTADEFLKMLKRGTIEYDGSIELDSLEQKGETR